MCVCVYVCDGEAEGGDSRSSGRRKDRASQSEFHNLSVLPAGLRNQRAERNHGNRQKSVEFGWTGWENGIW